MSETITLAKQRNIRLTAEEDDLLELLARKEDMPVSAFIRRTLRRALFLSSDVTIRHATGIERTSDGNVTSPVATTEGVAGSINQERVGIDA